MLLFLFPRPFDCMIDSKSSTYHSQSTHNTQLINKENKVLCGFCMSTELYTYIVKLSHFLYVSGFDTIKNIINSIQELH